MILDFWYQWHSYLFILLVSRGTQIMAFMYEEGDKSDKKWENGSFFVQKKIFINKFWKGWDSL